VASLRARDSLEGSEDHGRGVIFGFPRIVSRGRAVQPNVGTDRRETSEKRANVARRRPLNAKTLGVTPMTPYCGWQPRLHSQAPSGCSFFGHGRFRPR
jgi:hypothetical protein